MPYIITKRTSDKKRLSWCLRLLLEQGNMLHCTHTVSLFSFTYPESCITVWSPLWLRWHESGCWQNILTAINTFYFSDFGNILKWEWENESIGNQGENSNSKRHQFICTNSYLVELVFKELSFLSCLLLNYWIYMTIIK